MTDEQRKPLTLLGKADQLTVAVLATFCLVLIVVNLLLRGYQRGQVIEF